MKRPCDECGIHTEKTCPRILDPEGDHGILCEPYAQAEAESRVAREIVEWMGGYYSESDVKQLESYCREKGWLTLEEPLDQSGRPPYECQCDTCQGRD